MYWGGYLRFPWCRESVQQQNARDHKRIIGSIDPHFSNFWEKNLPAPHHLHNDHSFLSIFASEKIPRARPAEVWGIESLKAATISNTFSNHWIGGDRPTFPPILWKNDSKTKLSTWVFPKIMGKPLNHPLKKRVFHYFHHPFWGFSPYFWKHPHVLLFHFPIAAPYFHWSLWEEE